MIVVDRDGSTAGRSPTGPRARLDKNGAPDSTFSSNSMTTVDYGDEFDPAFADIATATAAW